MRGEDLISLRIYSAPRGSPPHARGRPCGADDGDCPFGITPACAGKTSPSRCCQAWAEDHPRMRGEDVGLVLVGVWFAGSPPHARGRLLSCLVGGLVPRITPACAGKTLLSFGRGGNPRDHPRMRGEDKPRQKVGLNHPGSPPHARGRPFTSVRMRCSRRITPACAGKTRWAWLQALLRRDHPRMRGEDQGVGHGDRCAVGSPPHARGRPGAGR